MLETDNFLVQLSFVQNLNKAMYADRNECLLNNNDNNDKAIKNNGGC